MWLFMFLLLFLEINTFHSNLTMSTIIVHTTNGPVVGLMEYYKNYSYITYKGIPYAEPPIGELRFEAPISLDQNWSSPRDATHYSQDCMQFDVISKKAIGNEDCLYLNVFVPVHKKCTTMDHCQLPVIVFIHGGGFMWGSSRQYGEQYIMRTGEAILVTLNYRLGAFGFLSTEDNSIQGNMGLKDQSMALSWIHKNIEQFHGDPEQILLTGWSAGGASVHYHMLSSYTNEAWFKGAISFSGTALCQCHDIYPGKALSKAQLMFDYLNCTTKGVPLNTMNIKQCLQHHTAAEIIDQSLKFYKYHTNPFAIFGPVLEHDSADKPFLTDYVENLMKQRKIKQKPWLITLTAQDGSFGAAEFLKIDTNGRELIYELNDRWLELSPILLFFNESIVEEEKNRMSINLKKKYFGENAINPTTYSNLENLLNDELSLKHAKKTVQLVANASASPQIYGYVYDNPAPHGLGQMLSLRNDLSFGTMHGDDIFIIFNNTEIRGGHKLCPAEHIISQNLIKMMINVAKNGVFQYDNQKLRVLSSENQFLFNTITKYGIT